MSYKQLNQPKPIKKPVDDLAELEALIEEDDDVAEMQALMEEFREQDMRLRVSVFSEVERLEKVIRKAKNDMSDIHGRAMRMQEDGSYFLACVLCIASAFIFMTVSVYRKDGGGVWLALPISVVMAVVGAWAFTTQTIQRYFS